MTLEQVMALEDLELNAEVAFKLGWTGEPIYVREGDTGRDVCFLLPPNATETAVVQEVPRFHDDWSAAMRIRDWARGLDRQHQRAFLNAVEQCAETRLGPYRKGWIVMDMEPVDFARAALLVSVEGQ